MLICHKQVVSSEAAVLQACRVPDVHATLAVSIIPASWGDMCRWAPHPVLSIASGFSNTITLQWRITTTAVAICNCRTHENCMHAEKIIIIFYKYFLFFALCIWYCFQLYYTEQQLMFTPTIFFYIIMYGKCIKQFIFHRWGVLPQPEVKPCKKIGR